MEEWLVEIGVASKHTWMNGLLNRWRQVIGCLSERTATITKTSDDEKLAAQIIT